MSIHFYSHQSFKSSGKIVGTLSERKSARQAYMYPSPCVSDAAGTGFAPVTIIFIYDVKTVFKCRH
jgi:hypothetical protein